MDDDLGNDRLRIGFLLGFGLFTEMLDSTAQVILKRKYL